MGLSLYWLNPISQYDLNRNNAVVEDLKFRNRVKKKWSYQLATPFFYVLKKLEVYISTTSFFFGTDLTSISL